MWARTKAVPGQGTRTVDAQARNEDLYTATSEDVLLATREDYFMATDIAASFGVDEQLGHGGPK